MKAKVRSRHVASDRLKCEVETSLAATLKLQKLLTEISSCFVTRPNGRLAETIEETQGLVCETLGLDRSTLWLFAIEGVETVLTHFWQRSGSVPLRRNFVTNGNLPWAEGMVRLGESFHFSSLDDLPPEAALDVETFRIHGTRSNATFPLVADGKVFGALAFACLREERMWTEDEISSLKLIAQIFSHVISRHRAEERAEHLREEIQRSSRASVLGEFSAALAHEINQPLTAILSNAQAARRFLDQGTANLAEVRAILDDIIRDDKRAGEVIRHLREMLSGIPARRALSCMNELVTQASEFLHSEMTGEEIELLLDLAPSLPRIDVVQVEVQQLLINLISNAVHAMSATPQKNRRINIRTSVAGPMVELRVRDFGCGISPDHLDRIFKPFHSSRSDGLGMGLAVCRRIAEAHGGSIVAANAPSAGAEFIFCLPWSSHHV